MHKHTHHFSLLQVCRSHGETAGRGGAHKPSQQHLPGSPSQQRVHRVRHQHKVGPTCDSLISNNMPHCFKLVRTQLIEISCSRLGEMTRQSVVTLNASYTVKPIGPSCRLPRPGGCSNIGLSCRCQSVIRSSVGRKQTKRQPYLSELV